jgi:alpha-galactosidase
MQFRKDADGGVATRKANTYTRCRGIAWLPVALVLLAALAVAPNAQASSNGQGKTPPMGWNSWIVDGGDSGCANLNQTTIEEIAKAMSTNGMKAAGYEYINLDDCWMATSRSSSGALVADKTKFPGGMPALVSYIHGLGLKIGLYEDMGTQTCNAVSPTHPGSEGYYQQDIDTYSSWGIDYIKMDWCHNSGLDPKTVYTEFSNDLASTDSNIFFSLCEWGWNQPWTWAPAIGNSWRTTPDIVDNWTSMIENMEATSAYAPYAAPGAWNDPDLLQVGNGGMTSTQDQTHFSMWAMMSAPLIATNDLLTMSSTTLATLTNAQIIAVDQDSLGHQGILLSDNGAGLQVWSKQVNGGTVVALLNQSASSENMTVTWSELGISSTTSATVTNLWTNTNLGAFTGSYETSVPAYTATMLKLNVSGTTPTQTVYEADASANTRGGTAVVQSCASTYGYSCLDGNEVGYIGGAAANTLTINDVNVATAGTYNMLIYGIVDGTRTFYISVNGGTAVEVAMTGTNWIMPVTSGLSVQLKAGNNTIEFSNPTASTPNLDHIVISNLGGSSSGNLIANGTYVVESVYSGLAVGDPGSSTADSVVMEQLTVTNAANQQWTVNNLGNNVITLENGASSQLLEVTGKSTANSALVDQYPNNGQTNQEWNVISLGSGEYELTNVNSGKALDVDGATKTSGTDIDQYTYGGKAWQQWKFVTP